MTAIHPPMCKSKSQSGFSIIELMVAALIGVIGCVVIFQVFAVFEGQKRSTTGGGDAQSSVALALHAIERDGRQAGYGINDPTFFGCAISGWQEIAPAAPLTQAFTVPFVPVTIQQGSVTPDPVSGGWPQPDTLTFVYGDSQLAHYPPKLIQNMGSAASDYRVSNRHGFELGDVLVAAEMRGVPLAPVCTLSQVRDLPGAVGSSDVIVHSPGSYVVGGITYQTRFNNAALGPNYTADTTRIYNLGQNPTVNTYSVSNGQLVVQNFRGNPTPIMDGIVQVQAQYGVDTNADNVVDVYRDEVAVGVPQAALTPAQWATVLSIRVGAAARLGQFEKTQVSPATINLWNGGPVWTLTAEERHYRYRIIDTIVPIRNMIWKRPP